MENEEILINQLFAGAYLSEGSNIGHEVINFFKDDEGDNYLYITPSGTVDLNYHPIRSVLFVRNVEGKTTVEVIAKAEELQTVDVDPKNVNYAGASISSFFSSNKFHGNNDPSLFFSFKAGKIRLPKAGSRIMLTINDEFEPDDESIRLIRLHSNSKAISNQSARKYYSLQDDHDAYLELKNLIDNEDYWEPSNTTEKLNPDGSTRRVNPTFLEIIRKENDELTFSNLLTYYFQYNRAVFQKFAKEVLDIEDFAPQFDIVRESNDNIDMWVQNSDYALVIENKIKSGLNGVKSDDYTQLSKYQEYTEGRIADPEDEVYQRTSRYYIFTPDYNHIEIPDNLKKPYKIVNYSEIYQFFCDNATSFIDDKYFPDFLRGLRNHTMSMSELNFSVMRSRFLEKINRV